MRNVFSLIHCEGRYAANGKPGSAWHAALEGNACSITRTFAFGNKSAVLELKQSGPYNQYELSIVSDTLRLSKKKPTIQFGEDGEAQKHEHPFKLEMDDWKGFSLYVSTTSFAAGRAESKSIPLKLSGGFRDELTIPLNLYQPLKVMDDCNSALLESWGMDPTVQMSLSDPIVLDNDNAEWFHKAIEYLLRAQNEVGSRTVEILLRTDEGGGVKTCKIFGPVGETKIGKQTCEKIIQNAELDAALDADGKPVESFLFLEANTFSQVRFINL